MCQALLNLVSQVVVALLVECRVDDTLKSSNNPTLLLDYFFLIIDEVLFLTIILI